MKTRLTETIAFTFRATGLLLSLLGFGLRYLLDGRYRREWDLEAALEDEGEDGPSVRRLLAEGGAA